MASFRAPGSLSLSLSPWGRAGGRGNCREVRRGHRPNLWQAFASQGANLDTLRCGGARPRGPKRIQRAGGPAGAPDPLGTAKYGSAKRRLQRFSSESELCEAASFHIFGRPHPPDYGLVSRRPHIVACYKVGLHHASKLSIKLGRRDIESGSSAFCGALCCCAGRVPRHARPRQKAPARWNRASREEPAWQAQLVTELGATAHAAPTRSAKACH